MPKINATRDHAIVIAAARKCLDELSALNELVVTQQVALSIGFAEGLLDELIEIASAGKSAPTIGSFAKGLLEMRP